MKPYLILSSWSTSETRSWTPIFILTFWREKSRQAIFAFVTVLAHRINNRMLYSYALQ